MNVQRQLAHPVDPWLVKYGPWAVVTGASSGIGEAIATELANRGMHLVLVARSKGKLDAMARDFRSEYGIEVMVISVDIALERSVKAVLHQTAALDVGLLVASAGFGTSGHFLKGDMIEEIGMLHVNCRALMMMALHFGKQMKQRGSGGMILLSSIVGFQGMPNAAHYAATKAYVQTLAEALYIECKQAGVDVLASAPGPTTSGFAERAGMKMGVALRPSEVAIPILNALGKKPTVLPGRLSKVLTYSLVLLPRRLRVWLMGRVMHGMTKHKLEFPGHA